jgi:hypothetical protein
LAFFNTWWFVLVVLAFSRHPEAAAEASSDSWGVVSGQKSEFFDHFRRKYGFPTLFGWKLPLRGGSFRFESRTWYFPAKTAVQRAIFGVFA